MTIDTTATRSMPRWVRTFLAAALAAVAIAAPSLPAQAAENATPGYQIKLQLDPAKVLDSNHRFTSAAVAALSIGSQNGLEKAQYLDSSSQQLAAEGWSSRIKREDGADSLKITYKKRFSIDNGGTAEKDIDKALDRANDAGFDASDSNYAAQVNMSYSVSTLDFSVNKKVKASGLGSSDLPAGKDSRSFAVDQLPGKLDKWKSGNWAKDILASAKVYGPVTQTSYSASISGHPVDLQLTPLNTAKGVRYYLEASVDSDTLQAAGKIRGDLISALDGKGWLLHENAFKTDLVLANY
ncbi:hypothetical protein [Arthrobacter russicus]|uniref:Uncharacterized protein n=1 Tax=Arthrobacter russicus TaxID=172040 RepID=A0ABU1J7T9_9MICC|nr:hypothetical protein [Arthrobacter russicus]MDN5668787.1 hypothetical protein [Renibacterium salmoninarum]MDR6268493.1 hypothetical protein [Arthrobacter russicus]